MVYSFLHMLEKRIELYFALQVLKLGGKSYKWRGHSGAADRIACLPDGSVWFVELKTHGGRLSALQKVFAADMKKHNYTVLWSREQVDEWYSDRIKT